MYSFGGIAASILALGTFAGHTFAKLAGRPAICLDTCTSYNLVDWFALHDVQQVTQCNGTMLPDFNIFNDLSDPYSRSTIHVCASSDLDQLRNLSVTKTASSATSTRKAVQMSLRKSSTAGLSGI
ncbi:glycoside hydrolase [Penicillium taxi]|uniref:glycoside hydrolase n=1 Tax=Penicillium taxi TaxID=168475 RepID=UPI0025456F12|nr:glycoside hydrolase [Penicillium taxi]KAJ5902889.1 glycoside hydrolase [Penicillium taxi]